MINGVYGMALEDISLTTWLIMGGLAIAALIAGLAIGALAYPQQLQQSQQRPGVPTNEETWTWKDTGSEDSGL